MVLATIALCVVVQDAQAAPQQVPTSETTVTSVALDVVVRDGRGRLVGDLRADEFTIEEDAVKQVIDVFRPPLGPSSQASDSVATDVVASGGRERIRPSDTASRSGRAPIALVFDLLSAEARVRAVRAAERFIGDAVLSPVPIGVFQIDGSLQVLQDTTRDGLALRAALSAVRAFRDTAQEPERHTSHRDAASAGPATLPTVSGDFDAIAFGAAASAQDAHATGYATADTLMAIARAWRDVQGRKSLVLFSEGIRLTAGTEQWFDAFISMATRTNLAVYAVDAAGLRAESQQMLIGQDFGRVTIDGDGNMRSGGGSVPSDEVRERLRRAAASGLGLLAAGTGGHLFHSSNALGRVFQRLEEDAAAHYLLTYTPTNTIIDGRFRQIRVKVTRPGLTVVSRKGYVAVPR